MEIITQSAKLVDGMRPLELVEYCARVCYASLDKIKPGSAKQFVTGLVHRGHYTPLEHAYLRIYPHLITDSATKVYITNLYNLAAPSDYPYADRRPTRGAFYRGKDERGAFVAGNMRDIYTYVSAYDPSLDLYETDVVQLAPDYAVLEFITDRGIATEFFRHRTMSYDDSGYENGYISYSTEYVREPSVNQQSTRYVSFAKHPYSVILPEPFAWAYHPESQAYQLWYHTCETCFNTYKLMLDEQKLSPEQARNVLPLSTATTVVLSGSVLNWLYLLNLRMPVGAHPQARMLACKIWEILRQQYPDLIDSYCKGGKLDMTYDLCNFNQLYDELQALVKRNKGDIGPCQWTQTTASEEKQ